jgi:two-component system, NarL family, sensor kinase
VLDTKILILAIVGSLVTIILCTGVLAFFVIFQRKKAQQLADHNRHQQEILQTQIEIQQQSFENISHEIHDNIGQVLSLIKLNLSLVSEHTDAYPFHEKIVTSTTLTSQVINSLRHLSKGLNPGFVEQLGLSECIRFELERLENAGVFKTTFLLTGKPIRPELSKEFVLYRIVQECLNNIIKHVREGVITVELQYLPGKIAIAVTDNGNGFDIEKVNLSSPAAKGSGLGHMKKRMEMIGGTFECISKLGEGTRVCLVVDSE